MQVAKLNGPAEKQNVSENRVCTLLDKKAKALGLSLVQESKNGNMQNIVGLICKGAPFISDLRGTTSLHWAAYNNQQGITELLLNSGINCNDRNRANRTPLHLAAQCGHSSIVKTLLSYGADYSALDMLEMTPLHWAIESGDVESIKALLFCGVKHNKNKFGKTPLSLAESKGLTEICELIKNAPDTEFKFVNNSPSNFSIRRADSDSGVSEPVKAKIQMISKTKVIKQECDSDSGITSSASSNDVSTLNLLKEHGIQMIETAEGNSIVTSAIESGQQIILTEAGKLALGKISSNDVAKEKISTDKPVLGVKRPLRPEPVGTSVIKRIFAAQPAMRQKLVKISTAKINVKNCAGESVSDDQRNKEVIIFEGKAYSKTDENLLIKKIQKQILQYRQQGKTLEMFARKKFREANKLQQELQAYFQKTGRTGDPEKM